MGNNLTSKLQNRTAVARQDGPKEPTVYDLLNDNVGEIARALPKHMSADRMARLATSVMKSTPALLQCDVRSLLGAIMTASQLGLEPGILGECYLVPFKGKVQFIPGYKGLIKLAWQSGQVKMIYAHMVYENDEFDYALGLNARLEHRPADTNRGKPKYVYAVAHFTNGGYAFEVMSVADVELIRQRSMAKNNGPWVTDWVAMAKKTVLKQLFKYVPLSPELTTVAKAAELDGVVRTDLGANIDEANFTYDNDTGELTEPAPAAPPVQDGPTGGDYDQPPADWQGEYLQEEMGG
jgi:recombination protein RecT